MLNMARNQGRHIAIVAAVAVTALAICAQAQEPVYSTYGVHNPAADSNCANTDCIYVRQPGEPTDPHYPPYWSSH